MITSTVSIIISYNVWSSNISGDPIASDRCDKVRSKVPEMSFEGVKKPKSFVLPILDILKDISGEF